MPEKRMFRIEIEGGPELEAAFKRYGTKILSSQELIDSVVKSGIEIGNEAKVILNDKIYNGSDPGAWRRSGLLRARTKGDDKARIETGMIITSVRARTKYAKYIEKGTGIFATGGQGRKTPWVYKTNKGFFLTTRGARARPFLRPALNRKSKPSIRNINRGLLKFLANNASKV